MKRLWGGGEIHCYSSRNVDILVLRASPSMRTEGRSRTRLSFQEPVPRELSLVFSRAADRRHHGHAAAVPGGPAAGGAADGRRGHRAALPADLRHHRQDPRRRGAGRPGAGETVRGSGLCLSELLPQTPLERRSVSGTALGGGCWPEPLR